MMYVEIKKRNFFLKYSSNSIFIKLIYNTIINNIRKYVKFTNI